MEALGQGGAQGGSLPGVTLSWGHPRTGRNGRLGGGPGLLFGDDPDDRDMLIVVTKVEYAGGGENQGPRKGVAGRWPQRGGRRKWRGPACLTRRDSTLAHHSAGNQPRFHVHSEKWEGGRSEVLSLRPGSPSQPFSGHANNHSTQLPPGASPASAARTRYSPRPMRSMSQRWPGLRPSAARNSSGISSEPLAERIVVMVAGYGFGLEASTPALTGIRISFVESEIAFRFTQSSP